MQRIDSSVVCEGCSESFRSATEIVCMYSTGTFSNNMRLTSRQTFKSITKTKRSIPWRVLGGTLAVTLVIICLLELRQSRSHTSTSISSHVTHTYTRVEQTTISWEYRVLNDPLNIPTNVNDIDSQQHKPNSHKQRHQNSKSASNSVHSNGHTKTKHNNNNNHNHDQSQNLNKSSSTFMGRPYGAQYSKYYNNNHQPQIHQSKKLNFKQRNSRLAKTKKIKIFEIGLVKDKLVGIYYFLRKNGIPSIYYSNEFDDYQYDIDYGLNKCEMDQLNTIENIMNTNFWTNFIMFNNDDHDIDQTLLMSTQNINEINSDYGQAQLQSQLQMYGFDHYHNYTMYNYYNHNVIRIPAVSTSTNVENQKDKTNYQSSLHIHKVDDLGAELKEQTRDNKVVSFFSICKHANKEKQSRKKSMSKKNDFDKKSAKRLQDFAFYGFFGIAPTELIMLHDYDDDDDEPVMISGTSKDDGSVSSHDEIFKNNNQIYPICDKQQGLVYNSLYNLKWYQILDKQYKYRYDIKFIVTIQPLHSWLQSQVLLNNGKHFKNLLNIINNNIGRYWMKTNAQKTNADSQLIKGKQLERFKRFNALSRYKNENENANLNWASTHTYTGISNNKLRKSRSKKKQESSSSDDDETIRLQLGNAGIGGFNHKYANLFELNINDHDESINITMQDSGLQKEFEIVRDDIMNSKVIDHFINETELIDYLKIQWYSYHCEVIEYFDKKNDYKRTWKKSNILVHDITKNGANMIIDFINGYSNNKQSNFQIKPNFYNFWKKTNVDANEYKKQRQNWLAKYSQSTSAPQWVTDFFKMVEESENKSGYDEYQTILDKCQELKYIKAEQVKVLEAVKNYMYSS